MNDDIRVAGSGRREFLKQAAAAGSVLALGAGPALAQSQTPVRGGKLTIAATGAAGTDSLDPRTISSIYHGMQAYLYGNCLTEMGEGNRLVGELAESWESSQGGRRQLFALRKGVSFHNGRAMTAADVVWSINLHRGADSKSAAKVLLDPVTDVRADGNNVIFETAEVYADLPYVLSDQHLIIVPANTTDFNVGVGTGPYVVQRYVPGQRIAGTRNPNYWKQGRAHVAECELLAVGDTTARMSALQSGEIQMMERVDTRTAGLLERVPGIQVLRSSTGAYRPFMMLCDNAPYNNADLRMALKLAIDREDLLKRVFRGYGRVGNDHPIGNADPFHATDIAQRTYDPEQARSLYRRSGHSGPLMLSFSDVAFAEAPDAATVFKEHASRAGINIELVREPNDGYWNNVWRKKPFCAAAWGGRPTAGIMLATAFKAGATFNDSNWNSPEFDAALAQARAELNDQKRRELYSRCQRLINTTGGCINPIFADVLDGARANVRGFFPGNYAMSGMRVVERVWLT